MSDQLTHVWVGFCLPWWEEVVGCSEAGLTLYRAPGRMGTLAEQLAPWEAVTMRPRGILTPLVSPR